MIGTYSYFWYLYNNMNTVNNQIFFLFALHELCNVFLQISFLRKWFTTWFTFVIFVAFMNTAWMFFLSPGHWDRGAEFALPQTLQRHKRHVHGGIKSFKCEICGKSFNEMWALLNHKKTVHEKIRKRFQCSQCPKSFCRKHILTKHMKNIL